MSEEVNVFAGLVAVAGGIFYLIGVLEILHGRFVNGGILCLIGFLLTIHAAEIIKEEEAKKVVKK